MPGATGAALFPNHDNDIKPKHELTLNIRQPKGPASWEHLPCVLWITIGCMKLETATWL